MPFLARMLSRSACLALALVVCAASASPRLSAASPQAERAVYLAGDLPDENLIVLSAALSAWREDSVLLLDSSKAAPYLKAFLNAYKPARIVPVGTSAEAVHEMEGRLGIKTSSPVVWTHGPPTSLWRSLFRRADDVVVCPAHPRGALLQAACLAGVLHAPLYVVHGRSGEEIKLAKRLGEWQTQRVYLVGKADKLAAQLPGVERIPLASEMRRGNRVSKATGPPRAYRNRGRDEPGRRAR